MRMYTRTACDTNFRRECFDVKRFDCVTIRQTEYFLNVYESSFATDINVGHKIRALSVLAESCKHIKRPYKNSCSMVVIFLSINE